MRAIDEWIEMEPVCRIEELIKTGVAYGGVWNDPGLRDPAPAGLDRESRMRCRLYRFNMDIIDPREGRRFTAQSLDEFGCARTLDFQQ